MTDDCSHPHEQLMPTGRYCVYKCGACGQFLRAREVGLNPRALKRNPRVRRSNPNLRDTSPRSRGTNARATAPTRGR
jgi:hypothetical protein